MERIISDCTQLGRWSAYAGHFPKEITQVLEGGTKMEEKLRVYPSSGVFWPLASMWHCCVLVVGGKAVPQTRHCS